MKDDKFIKGTNTTAFKVYFVDIQYSGQIVLSPSPTGS